MQKFMLLTTTTPLNFEKLTLKNNVLKNCLPPAFQPQRQDCLAIVIAIVATSVAFANNFSQPRPQFKTLRKMCQKCSFQPFFSLCFSIKTREFEDTQKQYIIALPKGYSQNTKSGELGKRGTSGEGR